MRCAAIAATGVLAVWGARQRERTARPEGRSAVLSRAGAVLGASLDVEETLGGVARLVVPVAAGRVAVDLVEDGAIRRVAEAHAGGTDADARPDHDARVAEVARTGEAVLVDDTAILPLRAHERTVGVLTLASAGAPPAAGSLELAFARELAAECATAIDNARLHFELRASEEALRHSNDQLGAILGGVADGVLARDAAGHVVYANAAAAAVLRRPSVEALRHTRLDEVTRWVRLYDESGSLVDAYELPGARLLRGDAAPDRRSTSASGRRARPRWRAPRSRRSPGGLEAPVAHTARLLASELVTNSVRRGGGDEDDWIGFEVALSPSVLRVQVTDHGPGFAPAPARPGPDEVAGRGLFLVDALADRWGSADGGTRVWFEVDRPVGDVPA